MLRCIGKTLDGERISGYYFKENAFKHFLISNDNPERKPIFYEVELDSIKLELNGMFVGWDELRTIGTYYFRKKLDDCS